MSTAVMTLDSFDLDLFGFEELDEREMHAIDGGNNLLWLLAGIPVSALIGGAVLYITGNPLDYYAAQAIGAVVNFFNPNWYIDP